MKRIRKLFCAAILMLLLPALFVTVNAMSKEETAPYIERMISYYLKYQEGAQENIEDLLDQVEAIDPAQAAVWERIMDTWAYTNTEMPVHTDVLPDGLPQDDSLCIVALGYQLNKSGSMKPELIQRLEVTLRSAQKYPNAYVAVSGGPTSYVKGVTEAGQMAQWLMEHGVAENRLIIEERALSTTENATNLYQIFTESYPMIESVAVVSSDYHIPWGCMMFSTVSEYRAGYENMPYIEVVGNASCATSSRMDTLYSQALGICTIAGVTFRRNTEPALYLPEETMVQETQTEPNYEVEFEEADNSWMFGVPAMAALAASILAFRERK